MVASTQHDEVNQTETMIFKRSVAVGENGECAKRAFLLTLEFHCQDVTATRHLINLVGNCTVRFNQGHFTATTDAMEGGVAQMPKFGEFRCSGPNTSSRNGFSVLVRGGDFLSVMLAFTAIRFTTETVDLLQEFRPLLFLPDGNAENGGFISEATGG